MHVSPDSTVIELSGPDRAGKLAEVTKLLMNNGCNVRSAAVRRCIHVAFPCSIALLCARDILPIIRRGWQLKVQHLDCRCGHTRGGSPLC